MSIRNFNYHRMHASSSIVVCMGYDLSDELFMLREECPWLSQIQADLLLLRMLCFGHITTHPYWRRYNAMFIQRVARENARRRLAKFL